jgi:hypothetical protein
MTDKGSTESADEACGQNVNPAGGCIYRLLAGLVVLSGAFCLLFLGGLVWLAWPGQTGLSWNLGDIFVGVVWIFGTWQVCDGKHPSLFRLACVLTGAACVYFVALFITANWMASRSAGHVAVEYAMAGGLGGLTIVPLVVGLAARGAMVRRSLNVRRVLFHRAPV